MIFLSSFAIIKADEDDTTVTEYSDVYETAEPEEGLSSEKKEPDAITGPLPETYSYELSDTRALSEIITTQDAYRRIIALKSEYPDGSKWNRTITWYLWRTNYYVDLYECAGWAAYCSNAAFGDDPNGDYWVKRYAIKNEDGGYFYPKGHGIFTYDAVRPGDIIRNKNDTHSVVVLEKYDDHIVICDANRDAQGTVRWGRIIEKKDVQKMGYLISRYPDPPAFTDYYEQPNGLRVQWEEDEDATKYWVYRKRGGGSWSKIAETSDNYYVDPDVREGDYLYRVKSYIPGISWSHYSNNYDVTVYTTYNPFDDVHPDQYYFDSVLWAYGHNPQITTGTSAHRFSPDATCTRGQVVTFLYRAAGNPQVADILTLFSDISPDDYYYNAVLWAYDHQITTGTTDTTFEPDKTCTRAQVVAFLWRFAGSPEPVTTANPFKDVKADKYYYKAVLWALENGITTGTTKTTFEPDKTCTRAQVVTFLYRYMR